MKQKIIKLVLCFLTFFSQVKSQDMTTPPHGGSPPVPVEVLAGNDRLVFQMIINKKLAPKSKVGFLSVAYFAADYDNDKVQNESMIPVLLNYEVIKNFSITGGAALNSNWGFRPFSGVQYLYANPKFLVVVLPGFYLTETHNFETLALFEFKPMISRKIGFYSRIQTLYNYSTDTKDHDRSYLYLRVGISIGNLAFGAGANLDKYGPSRFRVNKENYGVFFKADLF